MSPSISCDTIDHIQTSCPRRCWFPEAGSNYLQRNNLDRLRWYSDRNEGFQWLFRFGELPAHRRHINIQSQSCSGEVRFVILSSLLVRSCSSGWPIGFLVREVLESTCQYDVAVEQLAQSSIIAPCYFTVCGTRESKTQGTLITRQQTSEENRSVDEKTSVELSNQSFGFFLKMDSHWTRSHHSNQYRSLEFGSRERYSTFDRTSTTLEEAVGEDDNSQWTWTMEGRINPMAHLVSIQTDRSTSLTFILFVAACLNLSDAQQYYYLRHIDVSRIWHLSHTASCRRARIQLKEGRSADFFRWSSESASLERSTKVTEDHSIFTECLFV